MGTMLVLGSSVGLEPDPQVLEVVAEVEGVTYISDVADVDGNGVGDLALGVAREYVNQLTLHSYRDDGLRRGPFLIAPSPLVGLVRPILVDLDGDGRAELIAVGLPEERESLLLLIYRGGAAALSATPTQRIQIESLRPNPSLHAHWVGDHDGDGFDDFVAGVSLWARDPNPDVPLRFATSRPSVLFFRGGRDRLASTEANEVIEGCGLVESNSRSDFDADGFDDLVVLCDEDEHVAVHWGGAEGARTPIEWGAWRRTWALDFNGDGRTELVAITLGDGDGGLSSGAEILIHDVSRDGLSVRQRLDADEFLRE